MDDATALAALETALAAAGIRVAPALSGTEPPCAMAFSEGSSLEGLGRGQVPWRYRVTLIAGRIDQAAMAAELATLRVSALGVLLGLAGWHVLSVSRDGIRDLGGASMLACDVTAERMVEITVPT